MFELRITIQFMPFKNIPGHFAMSGVFRPFFSAYLLIVS